MLIRKRSPLCAGVARSVSIHRGPFVVLGLLVLAGVIYLPYALKGGWYYDDWSFYATFQDAGGGWGSQFSACTSTIAAGRKLTCLYHVTEYHLLANNRAAYHLVAIAFLVTMAGLVYVILRRCRMPWSWAALVSALLIIFPASDSTRLWPTGAIGQYVIVLVLIGVLIALSALRRPRGPGQWTLQILSALLFVGAMATYEIAVPLVALNGIIYWAAEKRPAAIRRGVADFLLAAGFVMYRLVVAPADPSEGFTVHRTLHGYLSRASTLVESAWNTWHESLLPGAVGTFGIVVVVVAACVLAALDDGMRRRLRPWAAFLFASLVVAGASTFVFVTANDFYTPQVSSVFNRVTLPASIAYVCLFVALLGFGYEIVRCLSPLPWVAVVAVGIVALGSGRHQFLISTEHKRSWEASWREQEVALEGYSTAMRGIPRQSRIIGMGAPIWEPGFIPVFAAPWDLSGAIDYTTAVDPPIASPLFPTMSCGRRGMVLEGTLLTPYRVRNQPLYFISAVHRPAVRVASSSKCRRVIARWGRPPFFAELPPG